MMLGVFLSTICLFVAVFTFDISFNIRRINNNLDRVWRKLAEIEMALGKKQS